jgi:O-antigen ligase
LSIAFSVWGTLSLFWTISFDTTIVAATTLVQFVASVWVIREFVRTREEIQPLLAATCFGLFVPLVSILNNFRLGATINRFESRFSGSGFNADQAGLYLVLGLPIAWHLIMNRRDLVRVAGVIYIVMAPVGLMLTATRGAVVAGIAACSIIPLTLPRQSLRTYALVGVMLILGTVSATMVVPRANLERILGITNEVTGGGSMSGRTDIWSAGLQAFPQRPLLGAGLGASGEAIQPYLHKKLPAHNMALGMVIEVGIVGLGIFAALLGACAWTIFRSPAPHRALWGVILLTWLVAGLSGSPEAVKFTWVLFGLIAAQSGLARTVSNVSRVKNTSRPAAESLRPLPI